MTRWHPDTCKCIIDNMSTFVNRCLIHQTSTVNNVITHNKLFSVLNYNLPKKAWHKAKQKTELKQTLTPPEIVMFAKYKQMLDDKATEKART